MYRLFGQIKEDGSSVSGYVVLDLETNKAVPRALVEVTAMLSKGVSFANAKLDGNKIVGTEASLERLPVFSRGGNLVGKPKITILGEVFKGDVSTGFYIVMDTFAHKQVYSTTTVINLLRSQDATNAKLVQKGDKFIISAIQGHFNQVKVSELKGVLKDTKSNSSKSTVKKFNPSNFKSSKYLVRTVDRILRYSAYGSVIKLYKPVLRLLDSPESYANIKSVKDIRRGGKVSRDVVEAYNSLLCARALVEVSYYRDYTSGMLFEQCMSSLTPRSKIRHVANLKRSYNKRVRRYKALKAVVARLPEIKKAKQDGDFLSSDDYCLYLADCKGLTGDEAFGLSKKKEVIDTLKERIESESNTIELVNSDKLTLSDFPFFKEYVLRGKLAYTLEVLKGDKVFEKITSKKLLYESLDVLFLLAFKKEQPYGYTGFSSMNKEVLVNICNRVPRSVQELLSNEIKSLGIM